MMDNKTIQLNWDVLQVNLSTYPVIGLEKLSKASLLNNYYFQHVKFVEILLKEAIDNNWPENRIEDLRQELKEANQRYKEYEKNISSNPVL